MSEPEKDCSLGDARTTTDRIDLQHDIRGLLNRHSAENGSNTPDFLLASFLMKCLAAWEDTVVDRDRWFGNFPSTQSENVDSPRYTS